jgi:2-methylcitrate dehydratase
MTPLRSAVPPVQAKREYDPEIKDIASYIHNTPIDSELAVGDSKISKENYG